MSLCKRCYRLHDTACPKDQWKADLAEADALAVLTSSFSRWCTNYLASLSTLAHAGVALGKE